MGSIFDGFPLASLSPDDMRAMARYFQGLADQFQRLADNLEPPPDKPAVQSRFDALQAIPEMVAQLERSGATLADAEARVAAMLQCPAATVSHYLKKAAKAKLSRAKRRNASSSAGSPTPPAVSLQTKMGTD